MVSTWRYIGRRAEVADPKLDTGAIVGIACAIGALMLGAIGLFIIYWRRQKQYEREDRVYQRPVEENPLAAPSPPIYTHDYKMKLDSTADGSASTYAYSAEFPKDSPFSGSESVSAMPTHPAYIPRALVRPTGSTTPSSTPGQNTPRSQMSLQPPPPPKALRKSRPDDIVMQAYLRAADGERVPSEIFRLAAPPTAPPPAPQMTLPISLPLRSLAIPTSSARRFQPTLTIDTGHERRPIARRDDMEITAPMGLSPPKQSQAQFQPFQQRYHQLRQQAQPMSLEEHPQSTIADRRAQLGHHRDESAAKRISTWMAGQPYIQQNAHRYQTTQVPPDSDVW